MKLSNANAVREKWTNALLEYVAQLDEDVERIGSNSFNFPIVENGEEGWIEITVKVPKENGDDGYLKRDVYYDKVRDKAQRDAEREKKKAQKIAHDKKMREQRAKEKS